MADGRGSVVLGRYRIVCPLRWPCGQLLPAAVHDALVDFADGAHQSGALLLRGLPVGELPDTHATPTTPADKDCRQRSVAECG